MANLFSSGAPHIHFFPSSATIVLVVRSANGDATVVLLLPRSILLNDDTYRWNCATLIVPSFGQIEQGAH